MAKLLLVDDDTTFLEAQKTLLAAQGFTVICAANGVEGYRKATTEKPDLMLLDVMMTYDTEGFDLARKLKEDPATKQIPVIIITGIRKAKGLTLSLTPDKEWLPVWAVLEKPVQPDELLKNVEAALKKAAG